MAQRETVAVLGAGGTMGLPMARNLRRAGFPVRAWNRSAEKAAPLREDGAELCESAREAAEGASVLLTMLSDGDAVLAAMDGDDGALASGGGADRVWLQMSTVGEAATERFAALARERDLRFADAPVLGTKQPAEQGQLLVLASGERPALENRLGGIFDAVGRRTMWVGEAGAASRLKLALNSWLLFVVEGAAETLALAGGLGLDPRLVLEAVSGGPLDLPYLQTKGASMLERSFDPAFTLELAAKDAGLVEEAIERHDLDLPVLRAIRERFAQGAEQNGEKDLSATYLTSAPD